MYQLPSPISRFTPEIKPRSKYQITRWLILFLMLGCRYLEWIGHLLFQIWVSLARHNGYWTALQITVTAILLGFTCWGQWFFRRERAKSRKQWVTAPW